MDQAQLQSLSIGIQILDIALYLLTAYWLFSINKKLWEKYAWLAFIPLANIYSFMKASWKPMIWILWIVLLYVWVIASTALMVFVWPIIWIVTLAIFITIIVMVVKILHWISVRCWRWAWTTVGFMFISFIMLPYVWYKMPDMSGKKLEPTPSETISL